MATKDLIKKMVKSRDVQPGQLKSEIELVTLEQGETTIGKIEQLVDNMNKIEESPDISYIEDELGKIKRQLNRLNDVYDSIVENMELIMLNNEKVEKILESLNKAKEKKPKLFSKLFRLSK